MASAAAAMRKTVTVLFCDLADSTELGERLDPERFRELLARWYEAMREPIERHGGTVEKFVGDAVMAVFGVPTVHEDDALRAVRAAAEMRASLQALNDELAGPRHTPLAVRIGINTGEVVTGDAATTLVSGDTVNTAKRLEQAARAGEILVGAGTRRLVANAADLEPVDAIAAKGKRDPVQAWRVVATIPGATSFPRRLDAPLVGRRDELNTLRNELTAATETRTCRVVTVLGPAGIGKSRLAAELVRDVHTITTRCLPYGDQLSLVPIVDLLHAAGGQPALLEAVTGDADGELLAARIGDGAGTQEELQWAIRRLIEARAREHPLVVCVEDVHWAQTAFLDLLEYVAGWTTDAPVLLLCLARPELLDERPTWPGAIVRLAPLDDAESQELLDALSAESPLDATARARIAEAADGNPLFLEQLVAMIAEGGASSELPPTVQALLEARLGALADTERAALERAAVIGRDFTRNAVAALSDDDDPAPLFALVRKELLRPASSGRAGDDAFRFRHGLIREAAYSSIPKRTRVDLHERAAAWLEANDGQEEIVGYHLEQAHRFTLELGHRDDALGARAGELLGAAGLRAAQRGDAAAARDLLVRSIAVIPPRHPLHASFLRELSSAYWLSGEVDAADRTLSNAISMARALGDVQLEWYGRLDRAARNTTVDGGTEALVTTAERAIDVFENLADDLGLARAWRRLGLAAYTKRQFAGAADAFERALAHAQASGDGQELARAADGLCTALVYGPIRVGEAITRIERILEGAKANLVLRAHAATALGALLGMQGDFDRARSFLADAAEIYDTLGLVLPKIGWTTLAAPTEALAGDLDEAARIYRLGFEAADERGNDSLRSRYAGWCAFFFASTGDHESARRFVPICESAPSLDAEILARLRATQSLLGDEDDAERLAVDAVTVADESDDLNLRAEMRLALARATGDADVLAEAKRLFELKGNGSAAAATGLWSLQR